jgi:phosphoribosyl-ATP pyrophosphohydrolase/phosphoribosyl-AMP cyclohydrolase
VSGPVAPDVRFDERGLVPVVAQDEATGRVLMVAWANRAALEATCATGRATFWSRSRRALWEKGESSGNVLDVVSVRLDCDGDTLLYRVRPRGPACHTGEASCFFRERVEGGGWRAIAPEDPTGGDAAAAADAHSALGGLPAELERVIDARRDDPDPKSYTALLWRRGEAYVAGKVTEEAAEVVDAAAHRGPQALAEEAADLVYHLLALLRAKGVSWRDVLSVLRERRASHGRGAKD